MRLLALICFVVFTSSLTGQRMIPDVDLKDLKGKTVNIKEKTSEGNLTVISFWATWCSPCKRELDAIVDLYPDWQEDYNVEFIAVTIDNSRALSKVPGMVEAKGWEYTVLSDVKQELQSALNFETVPQTFLLNGNGEIIYEHNGYNPGDEYELEDEIKAAASK